MIRRLLLLNGVSIVGVIFFHAVGWAFTAMLFWADRYGVQAADQIGTPYYYLLRLIEQLIVFCLPAFLFVSGYFIAFATGRNQQTVGWRLVGLRIRDLLIPYSLWTLVCWLLFLFEARFLDGRNYSIGQYVGMYLTGSSDPAYYYVPLLIQFYLLSPLFVWWAKRKPAILLLVVVLLQLAAQLQYYPSLFGLDLPYADFLPKWLFLTKILWFPMGIVAGFHLKSLQNWLARYRQACLAAALLLIPIGVVEWEWMQTYSGQMWAQHRETLVDSLFAVAVIFAFLGYYQTKLPLANWLEELGSRSFGIYLIHTLVMTYVARIIVVYKPSFLAYEGLFLCLMVVAGTAVPLLLMWLVNHSPLRPYYKWIFG